MKRQTLLLLCMGTSLSGISAGIAACTADSPAAGPIEPDGAILESDSGFPIVGQDSGTNPLPDATVNDSSTAGDSSKPPASDSGTALDSGGNGSDSAPDDSGPADSGSSADGNTCVHSACVPGAMLPASCATVDNCSTGFDPYCCTVAWDLTCILEQGTECTTSLADGGYASLGGTEQTVVQVSTTDTSMCAVTSTHDVYCWGEDEYGQIGDGRKANNATAYFPRKVGTGMTATIAEHFASCGVGTDQGLRCWGDGVFAYLSDGGTTTSPPAAAQLEGVTHLATGWDPGGSDVVSCAVATGGATYCWGSNNGGFDQIAPGVPRTGAAGTGGPGVLALSDAGPTATGAVTTSFSGGDNACVLVGSGVPVCWGTNSYGQLGFTGMGGNIDQTCIPAGPPDGGADCTHPIGGVVKIAMASTANCMLFADHSVKCIGANGTGEMAQGNTNNVNYDYPLTASLPPIADIAAGFDFFCAAPVDPTADVLCWGSTFEGELGPNTPDAGGAGTPVTVPGLSGVVSIAGGWQNMCAVKTDGSLWCWGDNGYFQLGVNGPPTQSNPTPVRVPVLSWP